MAIFTFDIDDQIAARIANAICQTYGYDPEMNISPVEFTREVTMRWLREQTLEFEAKQAAQAIRTDETDPMVNPNL